MENEGTKAQVDDEAQVEELELVPLEYSVATLLFWCPICHRGSKFFNVLVVLDRTLSHEILLFSGHLFG